MEHPEIFTTPDSLEWHKKGIAHPVQIGEGGRLRWPKHEVDRLMGKTAYQAKGV